MRKENILRGKKSIDSLFNNSKGFINYPLRCVYTYTASEDVVSSDLDYKALFIVGKRYSKLAVRRNLVRRRIKEAVRLSLPQFQEELKALGVSTITIAYLYVGKQEATYAEIEKCIEKVHRNVQRALQKDSDIHTNPIG